jgi:hypothetical protein
LRAWARIPRVGADPIMLSFQLRRFADTRLAEQCQCPVSLQIGEGPQRIRTEMIDGIGQEAGIREVEHAGLRNPETLPIVPNVENPLALRIAGASKLTSGSRPCGDLSYNIGELPA